MFAILSRLRRRKRPTTVTVQAAATAGARIADHLPDRASILYRQGLIEELKHEHRLLELSFALLVEAHRGSDVATCIACLNTFTNALRAHLLKENLQLYRYLKHAFRGDREASSRMAAMRSEMQAIGRELSSFAAEYLVATWDDARRRRLGPDLQRIGRILEQRIATEEAALYPLYAPPDRY